MRRARETALSLTEARTIALSLAALSLLAALAFSEENSGPMKEFTIEGTSRMEIKGDKPRYNPDLDPSAPLIAYLGKQMSTASSAPKLLVNLPSYLPTKLASDLVLSPWKGRIVRGPVLDILVKHPKQIKVASWRLVITDDQGRVFDTIHGKGHFPDRLTWEGRGHSGDMMKVGHPYAYSYFVLDEAQVPTYLPGKSISAEGVIDERLGHTAVILDTKSLFEGSKLTASGETLLREAQDILRDSGRSSFRVDVFGEEPELAQRRAETLRKTLSAALHWDESKVVAKGSPLDKTLYARVELLGK